MSEISEQGKYYKTNNNKETGRGASSPKQRTKEEVKKACFHSFTQQVSANFHNKFNKNNFDLKSAK